MTNEIRASQWAFHLQTAFSSSFSIRKKHPWDNLFLQTPPGQALGRVSPSPKTKFSHECRHLKLSNWNCNIKNRTCFGVPYKILYNFLMIVNWMSYREQLEEKARARKEVGKRLYRERCEKDFAHFVNKAWPVLEPCLLYTSPSPRD